MPLFNLSPPEYLAANLPAAAAMGNREVVITDVGPGGSLWRSNGSEWRPQAMIVLGRGNAGISDSSSTTEFNLASVVVPAGLLGLNGGLEVECLYSFTGSTNSKTCIVRYHATQGGVLGSAIISSATTTATNISFRGRNVIRNRNSASSQISPSASSAITMGFTTSGGLTGAVNTANAFSVNFNAVKATGAETMTLEWYEVRLLP